jgi:Mlc titration factor MtfA (ptsG expression regulator)
VKHGQPIFFDSYAATNETEFFAVVTEYFFSKPESMKHYHPKLYQVLQGFYRQDPAQKVLANQLP